MKNESLSKHDDGKRRCWWCGHDPLYVQYHDEEWGIRSLPGMNDDVRLFEKLSLEGFQAGLSWITILKKREAFRDAFYDFDIQQVAAMTERDVERLLQNEGIVRHRGKIEATINNAARALELIAEHGSLSDYFWNHPVMATSAAMPKPPKSKTDVVATTSTSIALSRDLKKRGFKFVGPTTMYAFMQSVGMVNDHIVGCDFRT